MPVMKVQPRFHVRRRLQQVNFVNNHPQTRITLPKEIETKIPVLKNQFWPPTEPGSCDDDGAVKGGLVGCIGGAVVGGAVGGPVGALIGCVGGTIAGSTYGHNHWNDKDE